MTLPPSPPEPPDGLVLEFKLLKLTEPGPPAPEDTESLISSTNIGSFWNYIN